MVSIPKNLQNDFLQAQGSNNPNACSKAPGDYAQKMQKSDPKGDKMAKIAEKIGMDEACQKQSRTFSKQEMFDSDTIAAAAGLWGVAGAANSTTMTDNVNDDEMMESGCGAFSVAAATIMNETANLSCVLNSALTGTTTQVSAGAKVLIKTIRPSQAVIANNNATLKDMTREYTKMVNTPIAEFYIQDRELAREALQLKKQNIALQAENIKTYIKTNSSNASVRNTSFNIAVKSSLTLKAEQKLAAKHKTAIDASIKSIAAAAAEQKMSQELGFRAGSANSKQIIQQEVDNIFKSEKRNIDEKIQRSLTTSNNDGNIEMIIQGGLDGNDINIDAMVQTNVQTTQAVDSGIDIGHRVAAQITADVLSAQDNKVKSKGFDDLVREANEGLAKQIESKGKSDANTFGGMGGALGGIFSGLGLLVMLPLLIILGVLFFAPRLVTGIIPPQIRTPLIIGIIVLIAVLIFTGFFRKSDRRRFPISSEFMSVDDELADTLGYMVTETKGQKNKMPYEDFNFTAGGTWRLN